MYHLLEETFAVLVTKVATEEIEANTARDRDTTTNGERVEDQVTPHDLAVNGVGVTRLVTVVDDQARDNRDQDKDAGKTSDTNGQESRAASTGSNSILELNETFRQTIALR